MSVEIENRFSLTTDVGSEGEPTYTLCCNAPVCASGSFTKKVCVVKTNRSKQALQLMDRLERKQHYEDLDLTGEYLGLITKCPHCDGEEGKKNVAEFWVRVKKIKELKAKVDEGKGRQLKGKEKDDFLKVKNEYESIRMDAGLPL